MTFKTLHIRTLKQLQAYQLYQLYCEKYTDQLKLNKEIFRLKTILDFIESMNESQKQVSVKTLNLVIESRIKIL